MQIVIDIPKQQYENLAKIVNAGKEPLGYWERVVMRGMPLPKGHGDLIDRNVCLAMKSRDLVDADGITMYAVPTGNILRINAVIPADKEEIE